MLLENKNAVVYVCWQWACEHHLRPSPRLARASITTTPEETS
jgi:hypothetical protein